MWLTLYLVSVWYVHQGEKANFIYSVISLANFYWVPDIKLVSIESLFAWSLGHSCGYRYTESVQYRLIQAIIWKSAFFSQKEEILSPITQSYWHCL